MDLDAQTACNLVYMLRKLHGKALAGPDVAASNGVDDGMDGALRQSNDVAVRAELTGVLGGLSDAATADLGGLILLGRGEPKYNGFDEARAAFKKSDRHVADLFEESMLVADHLRGGLDQIGVVCEGPDNATRG